MQIDTVIENFKNRGYNAHYFKTPEEAKNFLAEKIGTSATIGYGGSMTLMEIGLFEFLSVSNKVYYHSAPDADEHTMGNANDAQYYITSANAITQDGDIVNIDGRGNRVAAAIYGKNRKEVFIVCGTNKITENIEQAIWRAKNIAAPLNAKRLNRKTPCAIKADKCYNCASPERICRITSIMTRPVYNNPTTLILIEGNFGY